MTERLAEEYGGRATALEIAESDHSLLRFYLPLEARWAVINGREPCAHVVKQNPSLSGVIDVVDFAAERNGERDINPAKLRGVVETFSDLRYRLGLADVQSDFFGRACEYLLRKFAEGPGQSAGEFFTPTEAGFLMTHIPWTRPGETCHDYACGSAGLLIKLQLVACELAPTNQGAAQAFRPGAPSRELYCGADERHHPRRGGEAGARRYDDQPQVPQRRRHHQAARHRRRQSYCGTSRSRRASSPTTRLTAFVRREASPLARATRPGFSIPPPACTTAAWPPSCSTPAV